MLGDKVALARSATQEVRRNCVAELNGCAGALLAEENHVGEVGILVITVSWLLAEDAAGGEDGLDGADDETGRVEVEITSVVLRHVLA